MRIILTSLHRCDSEQQKINESPGWYRSLPKGLSAHAAGAAFDISISSHYVTDPDGNIVGTWREGFENQYLPSVIEDLGDILCELQETGIINVLVEHEVTEDEFKPICFHVCCSPDTYLSFISEDEG